MSTKRYVFPENARNPEYRAQLEEILATGLCPFCPENLGRWKREPIINEAKHWRVSNSDHPYTNAKVHLLLIPRSHEETSRTLSPEAKLELFDLKDWAEEKYGLPLTLLMRPSSEISGASVAHSHAHFIASDKDLGPVIARI
jgi:diadenosine tetraphosphate (Ap4A) HIT family hydrolase